MKLKNKPKKTQQKIRYCKYCGNYIDPETQKCTVCEKKYFKFKIPLKALSITLLVLLVVSIGVNVFLALFIKGYMKTENDTINRLQSKVEKKSSSLISTQELLDSTEIELEKQKEETEKYKAAFESLAQEFISNNSSSANISYNFSFVTDLLTAIKANPTEYNGKQIDILGTALKYTDDGDTGDTYIGNSNEVPPKEETNYADIVFHNAIRKSGIKIIISNDVEYSVLQTGDLVEITGTVTIERDEIYLDNCTCTIITPVSER